MEILGIDIGGSGIKAAPVNTQTGELLAPRQRIATPIPAKPSAVAPVVGQIAQAFDWHGPIGVGFPAVIQHGVVRSAANISKKWIGENAAELFSQATGCPVWVVNDADAAGVAEMTFGAGRGRSGVVLIVTIGTGLGSAIFIDGRLLPNTELGHLELDGLDAEMTASDAARKREEMSWRKWGKRFNRYLAMLEALFTPDLFILGGGTSKAFESFRPYLTVQAEIIPAQYLNDAGLVGAAMSAMEHLIGIHRANESAPSGGEIRRAKSDPAKGGQEKDRQTSEAGRALEQEMKEDPERPQVEPDTIEVIDPHKEMTPG